MPDLEAQVDAALPDDLTGQLGVAVSGGGDSIALLRLLHQVSHKRGIELTCMTVDHGLRPEARVEAEGVAKRCAALGVPYKILTWSGWDRVGNIQNAARQARYDLMAGWAKENGIGVVALGHTQDDQAETVLMRLARGAGVDGLSAMARSRTQNGVRWIRPLLDISRDDLRSYLRANAEPWVEDPSNEDMRFERVKARRVLDQLSLLGIDRAALGSVAHKLQSARQALEHQAQSAAYTCITVRAGGLCINRSLFCDFPKEVRRRLIVAGVRWIAGSVYAPRHRSVETVMQAIAYSGAATLEGCVIACKGDTVWLHREFNAVRGLRTPVNACWDGRWRLSGSSAPHDLYVAALGESGLAQCADWRATGLPRALLLASPAVWDREKLLAAPHAGRAQSWQVIHQNGETSFFDSLISH